MDFLTSLLANQSYPPIIIIITGFIALGVMFIKSQRGRSDQEVTLLSSINDQLSQSNLVAINHTHEIPDMVESQKRMEAKMDKMNDTLIKIEAKL